MFIPLVGKDTFPMKWMITADSSCDLRSQDIARPDAGFETVPFSLRIGGKEYVDEETMDIPAMLTAMENCPEVCRSACPSPCDAGDFGHAASLFDPSH